MRRRDRFKVAVLVLLAIAVFQIARELYQFYAHRAERTEIARLEVEIDDAGLGVILTKIRADTLLRQIEGADEALGSLRQELERYEREIERGSTALNYRRRYLERLEVYNQRVTGRNVLYEEWRATVDSSRAYVGRYNAAADSIRALAAGIGEPYYPIASPAEIAVRHEVAGSTP